MSSLVSHGFLTYSSSSFFLPGFPFDETLSSRPHFTFTFTFTFTTSQLAKTKTMFSYKTSAFAALAGLSLAAIPPVVRAATIDVVVGALNGSVIAYTPNYVVCCLFLSMKLRALNDQSRTQVLAMSFSLLSNRRTTLLHNPHLLRLVLRSLVVSTLDCEFHARSSYDCIIN